MKKTIFFLFLFFSFFDGFSQAYIAMPTDSAVWRYRFYNIDFETQVTDNILFLNGTDTIANGYTYHKIFSRSAIYTVTNDTIPPIASVFANVPDLYYGAMRESGKQVFMLEGAGEELLFDFNAGVGDSIPAYSGKIKVTGLDSISLNGVYHKTYLTSDSTFRVIEGVGSSLGLIPQINDGGSDIQFFCFTYGPVTYSPDTTFPCTTVYQIGHEAASEINSPLPAIELFPNPAENVLHINMPVGYESAQMKLYDILGRSIPVPSSSGSQRSLSTLNFASGIYMLSILNGNTVTTYKVEIK